MPFRASLDSALRASFGLSYPVTYEFAIPSGSSGLTAQRLYSGEAWETLTEHAAQASDYTGTEGVRFDYASDRAYVSAAFDNAASETDLWIRIMDGGSEVAVTYVGVTSYFDDRHAAAVVTMDDWDGTYHSSFMLAVAGARARGVWASPAIVPNGIVSMGHDALSAAQWADIQSEVDAGNVEPVSHSYEHPNAGSGTWDADAAERHIDFASDAITSNLTLPAQSRMGASQYVLGWVEPYGATNSFVQARLAGAGLLNQRTDDAGTGVHFQYVGWDASLGVYSRARVSSYGDRDTLAEQAAAFDAAYAAEGIHHVLYHPWLGSAEDAGTWIPGNTYDLTDPNNILFQHLDYIGGRDDVWYVGWGHLYAYRLAATEVAVVEDADPPLAPTGPIAFELEAYAAPAGDAVDFVLESEGADVTVEPGFIASTAQVYAPTITAGTPDPVAVEPAFIASTAVVYTPEIVEGLASGDAVRPSFIASASQVFEPSVQYGAVTIDVPFIASTSEVFAPIVGIEPVDLTGPFTVSLAPSRLSVTVHESRLTVS